VTPFDGLLHGLLVAVQPLHLGFCLLGVLVGTAVGVLPGLGPAATIALLLPATYRLDPVAAAIMLSGIYYGSQYGGSTTAILVKVPGESSSLVTCYDGHEMARRGRAGAALAIAALASFAAGTLAILGLGLVAPLVGRIALAFGPAEYAMLMLLGLVLVARLGQGPVVPALIMVVLGLMLATVGQDPVSGLERHTFGIQELIDGIDLVPVFLGMYGVAEVLAQIERREPPPRPVPTGRLWPSREEARAAVPAAARGGAIGFVLGVLPGGGATLASIAAYLAEKRFAAGRDRLGQGAVEGVAAPEAANNAAATSAFVPLLTLGIPANGVMAMILAALTLHGLRPGPQLVTQQPDLFWGVIASMYVGNLALLVLNLPLVGLFVQLLRLPYAALGPLILVTCLIGAFAVTGHAGEAVLAVAFGALGHGLRKLGFEPTPLVLALVLGRPFEEALRQALQLARGDATVFLTKPIAAVLLAAAVLALVAPLLLKARPRHG